MPLMYNDYLRKVAERFANRFADIAAAWLPLLGETGHQVRAIESIQKLCSLLRASARDGIDEVALDPKPGASFQSIHIAFFLEHLDGTLREEL